MKELVRSNKYKTNEKGITLMTLVITIIVILILAGVTISLVINGGIIDKASEAVKISKLSQIKEEMKIDIITKQTEEITQGKKGISNEQVQEIVNKYGELQEDKDTIKTEYGDISLKEIIDNTTISDSNSNAGSGGSSTDIAGLLAKLENLEQKVANLENKTVDNIYPVGSIYVSTNMSTKEEVENKLGGEWEQIKDRFLLSAGDIYEAGAEGGESEHTLTVAEMPSHTHSWWMYKFTQVGQPGGNNGVLAGGTTSQATGSSGGNKAHNNMPPYITVYVWKRVN